jgi:hypothetical protein
VFAHRDKSKYINYFLPVFPDNLGLFKLWGVPRRAARLSVPPDRYQDFFAVLRLRSATGKKDFHYSR